ncbi:MAG: hypothetical protein CTY20_03185 [Hyphomicrobium sp.]|nr:MAG: hypothetical protein CTY20_03185 [Hyphomicrobium sp.]
MPLRFKLMTAIFVLLMLMATDNSNRPFDDILNVFAGLAVFLGFALVSVIPNSGRTDRVDRALDGGSWADRIDVEAVERNRSRTPS